MSSILHAATGGHEPSDGQTVVLIHGAGGNRTVWAVQARHLAARGVNVLAIDLPGHGESPGPAHNRVEAYRDAIVEDLSARGLTNVGLAGHSMGAMIALAVTAENPGLVSRLALLGAALNLAVNDALLEATRDQPTTAIDAIIDWGHSPTSHVGGGQTPGLWMDGVDQATLRAEATRHPGSLHSDFTASSTYDGTSGAALVNCPTLVIAGQRDLMTSAKLGRAMAAAIDGAQLIELDDCGHFMTTERAADVARALTSFFTRQ